MAQDEGLCDVARLLFTQTVVKPSFGSSGRGSKLLDVVEWLQQDGGWHMPPVPPNETYPAYLE